MARKSTVLVVDDEPSARDTLEALMFKEGYNLAFAANGLDALDVASEIIPDVILLDVMMPEMDGFEVCQRVRADPLLAEVPVIMITALDDRDSRLRGLEAGADDFVSKPFDRGELRARVRTMTRLDRYRRLLSERSRFQWVVEQAGEGYLIVNERDEVLYANSQARLYLGLPKPPPRQAAPNEGEEERDDASTETLVELVRRRYRLEPKEAWQNWPSLSDEAALSPRYLVRPKSRTAGAFWLQVDVMETAPRSGTEHLICLHDVTQTVVNQLNVWTFQGLVNHKLRVPTSIMTGFLNVLVENYPTLSSAEISSYLGLVRKSALRLQDQVLDILQHMDASDSQHIHWGPCSIASVPEIVAETCRSLKIESFDVTFADDHLEDLMLPLSRRATELVLWELLENAKKFHPQGTPGVEVKLSDGSGHIHLQVSDDGLTLAPDQLTKMWTPYYQAEGTFSGTVPGMGLGLSTVARLMWQVGGTCSAHNREDGPGVVIELVLPLEEAGEQT